MKKVVYGVSRISRFGNSKMTGVGFITDEDLVIACVSRKGNAYIRVFEDCVKNCHAIPGRDGDKVCFFERFGGYWAEQEPELCEKMRSLEKKYNCLVYAITHEFTEFGELYDFLIVTDYPKEWDDLVYSQGSYHTAFAYVWNKDDDQCSEFGSVTVQSFGGGIKRIA